MSMATSLIGFDLLRDHQVQINKAWYDEIISKHSLDTIRYMNVAHYTLSTPIYKENTNMKIKELIALLKTFDQNLSVNFKKDDRSLSIQNFQENMDIKKYDNEGTLLKTPCLETDSVTIRFY